MTCCPQPAGRDCRREAAGSTEEPATYARPQRPSSAVAEDAKRLRASGPARVLAEGTTRFLFRCNVAPDAFDGSSRLQVAHWGD